jgi:hypothetical protein
MKIYLKSVLELLEEKGIGHGLEINGGKVKQQVSDEKKRKLNEHLKKKVKKTVKDKNIKKNRKEKKEE